MNYNEEIFNELKNRDDEIDKKNNLIMFRESSKNSKNSLSCESSSVQSIVEMRQALIGSIFGVKELMRLYEKTSVSDYFSLSPHSDSDFGVVRHLKREKKLRKSSYFIKKSCR